MLFLLTGRTPRSGRKHSLSLPQKMTCPTFMRVDPCLVQSIGSTQYACGCCAEYEALQCSRLRCSMFRVPTNPLPVAGDAYTQMLENTRSDLRRKSYANICTQNSVTCGTQAAASQHLMQTAAQGLAAAAEHACGLYRRRHGNCTQTFTDRLSGCTYRERSHGRLPVNRKGIVGPVLGTQRNRATLWFYKREFQEKICGLST